MIWLTLLSNSDEKNIEKSFSVKFAQSSKTDLFIT